MQNDNRQYVEKHQHAQHYILRFVILYSMIRIKQWLQNTFSLLPSAYPTSSDNFSPKKIQHLLPDSGRIEAIETEFLCLNNYEEKKSQNIIGISCRYPDHTSRSVIKFSKQLKPKIKAFAHAANMGYCRELIFYQQLSEQLTIKTPHFINGDIEKRTGDYFVILEKIETGRIIADHDNCPLRESRLALSHIAKLHAHPLQELAPLDWIVGETNDRPFRWIALFYKKRFPISYITLLNALCDYINTLTPCLVHVDFRPGNIFFQYDHNQVPQDLIIFDWAAPTITTGLYDVVYFMILGMDPNIRRTHYAELTDAYLSQLAQAGTPYSRIDFDKDFQVVALLFCVISYAYKEINLFEDWNVDTSQWIDWEAKTKIVVNELDLESIAAWINLPLQALNRGLELFR